MNATKKRPGRPKKQDSEPGRIKASIYWVDHREGKPPFCMFSKKFEDDSRVKEDKRIEHFMDLVSGAKSTAGGNNWKGRVRHAEIRDQYTDQLLYQFKDWDKTGAPYWRPVYQTTINP